MAKIHARIGTRKTHEVARVTVYACDVPENQETRTFYVLRSDGIILRRVAWRYLLDPCGVDARWTGSQYSRFARYRVNESGRAIVALVAQFGRRGQVSVSTARL